MGGRVVKRRTNRHPLRNVVKSMEREGRSSFNFCHGQGIYSRWYDLTLECGHVVERTARYEKGASGDNRGYARQHHQPPSNKMLPPPKRVRCEFCPIPEKDPDQCE